MPVTTFTVPEKYRYQNGFNSYIESEAVSGTLPIAQNSPQKPPFGLYAEKLSGTAFTAPRKENLQTWLYRVVPSASHEPFVQCGDSSSLSAEMPMLRYVPDQLRWDSFDLDETADWVQGLHLIAGAGDPTMKAGLGIMIFSAGRNMDPKTAIYSADGDWLIVIQHGVLDLQTEMGHILLRPNEIAVIPRGIRYRVTLPHGPVRGYILELYQNHFELPELGPIGSNGLANARDFQIPVACFDEEPAEQASQWRVICKFTHKLYVANQSHTPFDVVAWHGLYYPYKYDLGRFNVIGSTSFDHPDPSIYTVLTAQSEHYGTAVADFVIFPPRWLVAEDTFRPPWYHRNTMAEFMGLISGDYDAKTGDGFKPGGASLHNVMSAHGPDSESYHKAKNAVLEPQKVGSDSMAFMFETSLMLGVTPWGLTTCRKVQKDYNRDSWLPLKSNFQRPVSAEEDIKKQM